MWPSLRDQDPPKSGHRIKIFHIPKPQGILHTPESEDLGGYSRFPRWYLHVLPVQGGPAVGDHGGFIGVEEGADLAKESSLGHQDIQS